MINQEQEIIIFEDKPNFNSKIIKNDRKIKSPDWNTLLNDIDISILKNIKEKREYEKICKTCNKNFKTPSPNQKFCSPICRNKNNNAHRKIDEKSIAIMKIACFVRQQSLNELRERHKEEYDSIHEEIRKKTLQKIQEKTQ
jgi:hypothetical protein